MGVFGGIGGTSPSQAKGVFLTDGDHKIEVQRVKLIDSKKNQKTYFVVEGKVSASTNVERHPKAQLITWLCKLGGDYPEYALADIKSFTMAASGASSEEVDEEFMENVTDGDGDLLSGKVLMINVTTIETKAGGEFAKHSFSSFRAPENVEVAEA
jgi:hypothetical protein